MTREPGFYWVRRDDEVVVVAEWYTPTNAPERARFHFCDDDLVAGEEAVTVLSERLTPPEAVR